jgi:predicted nucleic acid-binding protein
MTYLLDTNGVIALLVINHEHHERVHAFFARRPFATSPQIQLGALRFLTRPLDPDVGAICEPADAWRRLKILRQTRAKVFVPDDLDCAGRLPFDLVSSHRHWNDFYLAGLAQHHGLKLATCDQALSIFFPEIVRLIPDSQPRCQIRHSALPIL